MYLFLFSYAISIGKDGKNRNKKVTFIWKHYDYNLMVKVSLKTLLSGVWMEEHLRARIRV